MQLFWRTDIVCLQCDRVMGSVDLASEHAPIPVAWSLARCVVCNGQPVRGDAVAARPLEQLLELGE